MSLHRKAPEQYLMSSEQQFRSLDGIVQKEGSAHGKQAPSPLHYYSRADRLPKANREKTEKFAEIIYLFNGDTPLLRFLELSKIL